MRCPVVGPQGGRFAVSARSVVLGVLPVAALVTMFVVGWPTARCRATSTTSSTRRRSSSSTARTLSRRPTRRSAARTSSGRRSPRTRRARHRAAARRRGHVMVAIGLACFALSLWLVGVRDWRVYGVVGLWPRVVGEMRVSHLTPVILCCSRPRPGAGATRRCTGVLVGARGRVKFFVWPLGVWLAATGRLARRCPPAVGRRRIPSPRPAVRSLATTPTPSVAARQGLRPGQLQRVRAPRAGRRVGDSWRASRCRGRPSLSWPATWRYRSFALARRGGARALADRRGSTTSRSRRCPSRWRGPGSRASGSSRSRPGGLRAPGSASATCGPIAALLLVFAVVFAVAFRGEPRARAGPPRRDEAPLRRALELVAFGGRTDRRARARALDVRRARTGSRSTSTRSSTRRRRPSCTATIPIRPRHADLSDGTNAIWPMAAVLPRCR